MKYIIIDDNISFAKALCEQLLKEANGNSDNKTCNEKTLEFKQGEKIITIDFAKHTTAQIANAIIETYGNEEKELPDDIVLLINVNLKAGERQKQLGIELLIWLRIKDVMNHVVLYSFETVHQLLQRKPKHLILTSKGTSFVQLPRDFELNFDKLSKEKADEGNLKKTLKPTFSNKNIQHRLANIYGLWFMFSVHNKYFSGEALNYDIFSTEFLKGFDELQLQIANVLSETNDKQVTQNIIGKITKLKTSIRGKVPKILYIDDKADIGWAEFLKKAIYGNGDSNNFQSITPQKTDFKNDTHFKTFFETVNAKILNKNNFVDCVLLDLRLTDETGDIDDLDSLSGIRLLKRIHQSFPSLPVVMFTASNKAKSVKKIITCGAEGLWTKPGLDELKNDEYYLESYRELLSYLNDALNKYTYLIEKHIVNTQFQVESITESANYPTILNDVNIILTDTTFWCNTKVDLVENHKSARMLLNLSSSVCHRKRFIVINDVINELFNHTQNKNKIDLQISSKYGLETIQKYKETKWIGSGFQEVENAIKENISYLKEPTRGGGFHIVSNVKKIHSYHTDEKEAKIELNKRKNDGYKPLHADDTFQMLISYYMEQHTIQYNNEKGNAANKTIDSQNVLFITDDFNSNVPNIIRTIGLKFGNNNWTIPKDFKKEEETLKINANGKHCLIVHSKVLHKICFPKSGVTVKTVEIPNTP